MFEFFASSPRGLENALGEELVAVGAENLRIIAGGVHFRGDWLCAYRANLESRLATRILWRLAHGSYSKEEDIYQLALRIDWPSLFTVNRTLRVATTAVRSPLRSLDFVTLRVKDAVCNRFRAHCNDRPSVDTRNPDVRIHMFLTDVECTLYIDTSGAPLWQRGLRQSTVEAPLKENLAAGILKLSGWQPGTPLLDPMCGSGTFLLEAAQIALNRAPGLGRSFGFEQLTSFDAIGWAKLRSAAEARCLPPELLPLYGSDIDPQAVRAARSNFQQAGLGNVAEILEADILTLEPPPGPGVMIANPPYCERIGEEDQLAAFYPKLGTLLKRYYAGWNCYFFSADTRLPKLIRLQTSRKIPLYNGPLECRLYNIEIVAGGNRRERAP